MMISSFRSDSSALPCVVALSGAYAAGEITAKEYNESQRVARLEDSVKKLFHKTTWSKVEGGDTVLLAADSDEIVEVTIKQARTKPLMENGPMTVFVHYAFKRAQYRVTFKPNETAYVRSRL